MQESDLLKIVDQQLLEKLSEAERRKLRRSIELIKEFCDEFNEFNELRRLYRKYKVSTYQIPAIPDQFRIHHVVEYLTELHEGKFLLLFHEIIVSETQHPFLSYIVMLNWDQRPQ